MKAAILPFFIISLGFIPAHPIPPAPERVASDSLILELTSTVPGREVRFQVLGSHVGAQLLAARLALRSDTLFATTPAQLRVGPLIVIDDLVLEIAPGEPWLHAIAKRTNPIDLWGDKFAIRRVTGRPQLHAPVLRTGKTPQG